MKKKNYIFVLTFLCMFVGQMGYGQDDYKGEKEEPIDGGNSLVVEGNWGNSEPQSGEIDNWTGSNGHDYKLIEGEDGNVRIVESFFDSNSGEAVFVIHKYDGKQETTEEVNTEPYTVGNNSSGDGGSGGGGSTSTSQTTITSLAYTPGGSTIISILEAAGISFIAINPVTRAYVITRSVAAYTIISTLSDSTCNGTQGGCQSWLNSNYIGASTSNLSAKDQRATGVEPVDMVDLAAYNHDVAYDNVNAKGIIGAVFDLNTLEADRDLLSACYEVLDMYSYGGTDPVTGMEISLETRERAVLIIEAFEIIVTEKELRN